MITLYRKHVNSLGYWRIWCEGPMLYMAHATCEGGSEVVHEELVEVNQSGRSLQEQVASRTNSRISRMKDKGYKETRDEALSSQTNQLGLVRPMLAQPLAKVSKINFKDSSLQLKMDGHRCLVTNQDEHIAYSRQGKLIPSIDHIMNYLKTRLPSNETLDGELYCHGVPLQTIGSWIKRKQPDTEKLWYVVYDMIADETFQDRYKELQAILKPLLEDKNCPVKLLPCRPYIDDESMWSFFHDAKNRKFEGLILRTNDRRYEDGVRSSSLIKIKSFEDTEVDVIDVEPSSEGWGVCVCVYQGKVFRTSAPGSKDQKREALENKSNYIGKKKLTIEFSMLTIDGIPFHPNAIRWREDI